MNEVIEPPAFWVLVEQKPSGKEYESLVDLERTIHEEVSEEQLEQFVFCGSVSTWKIPARTAPVATQIIDALARQLPDVRVEEMPAGHAPHIVSMDRFLKSWHCSKKLGKPDPATW